MIYSYKNESDSSKVLSEAVNMKRISHNKSKFVGSKDKVVINWGSSQLPEEVRKCMILNEPEYVEIACNKLKFFEAMEGKVNIPEYTTDSEEALDWVNNGITIVGRNILTGNSGKGIVLIDDEKNLLQNPCKLYVKYIPKKDEYRVHVINGEVVGVRRKALKSGLDKGIVNWKIRNLDNGFIFQMNDFTPEPEVLEESVKVFSALPLDFGAVDVIYNKYRKKAYVLEVNTAPGLEGSTISTYSENLLKMFEEVKQTKRKKTKDFDEWLVHKAFDFDGPLPVAEENMEDVPEEGEEQPHGL